jgi:hypothetical protein
MNFRICKVCGELFIPINGNQTCCGKPIIKSCIVCGKEFKAKCTMQESLHHNTCSTECKNQYTRSQVEAHYLNTTRICKWCGKEFHPRINSQILCEDTHYETCAICGKKFELPKKFDLKDHRMTCSKKCTNALKFKNGNPFQREDCREKAKATMLEKYGVEHPWQSPEILQKVRNTLQEKYGVDWYTKSDEYKKQVQQTNNDKYDTDWYVQSQDFKDKSTNTLLANYGVAYPMQSPEIRQRWYDKYKSRTGYANPLQNPEVQEKVKSTNLAKYGVEYVFQSPEFIEKYKLTMINKYGATSVLGSPVLASEIKQTNLKKYGYENPASSPQVQAKITETMIKKYGARYTATLDHKKQVMRNPEKAEEWSKFLNNPEQYMASHFSYIPNVKELEDLVGIGSGTIMYWLDRLGKSDLVKYTKSYKEDECINLLRSIDPDVNIQRNNRQLIKPYEIDIVLPDYNLGIEVNPTSTHNSTFDPFYHEPKPANYHTIKTDISIDAGIKLFHLFGYDWKHKRDIISSIFRNHMHKNLYRYYARKCDIRLVDIDTAYEFMRANHLFGYTDSDICLGLYSTNELVIMMTFKSNADNWELTGFCTKLNSTVIGGASKLFKYFISTYDPNTIYTYSDRARMTGNIYHMLGFVQKDVLKEQYVWVDLDTNLSYSPEYIEDIGYSEFLGVPIDTNLSEDEIMSSYGYVKVYDSGSILWAWSK